MALPFRTTCGRDSARGDAHRRRRVASFGSRCQPEPAPRARSCARGLGRWREGGMAGGLSGHAAALRRRRTRRAKRTAIMRAERCRAGRLARQKSPQGEVLGRLGFTCARASPQPRSPPRSGRCEPRRIMCWARRDATCCRATIQVLRPFELRAGGRTSSSGWHSGLNAADSYGVPVEMHSSLAPRSVGRPWRWRTRVLPLTQRSEPHRKAGPGKGVWRPLERHLGAEAGGAEGSSRQAEDELLHPSRSRTGGRCHGSERELQLHRLRLPASILPDSAPRAPAVDESSLRPTPALTPRNLHSRELYRGCAPEDLRLTPSCRLSERMPPVSGGARGRPARRGAWPPSAAPGNPAAERHVRRQRPACWEA